MNKEELTRFNTTVQFTSPSSYERLKNLKEATKKMLKAEKLTVGQFLDHMMDLTEKHLKDSENVI